MDTREMQHRRRDTVHFFENCDFDGKSVREISRVTWVGVAVNIGLAIIKTLGGVLSGSTALIADAVHTVSDLATDAAVLIGVRYWSAPADHDHPHGHRKIETLVTLAIGLALAAVGAKMGYDASLNLIQTVVGRRVGPPPEMNLITGFAFGASLASLVSKELLYRWTAAKGVQLESSAVVANAWHHRSDAFSSIPPALSIGGAALGARMGYDLWYLDPLGTLVVCVMLLQAAWEVAQPTLGALLDESADRQLCSSIRKTVLSTPGVMGAHRIRTRVIGPHAVEVDLHVTVNKDLKVWEGHAIASKVKYQMLKLQGDASTRVVDVMVYIEPANPEFDKLRESLESSDTVVDWKLHPDMGAGVKTPPGRKS